MIVYQSLVGDFYALCGPACALLLREWLEDPEAIGPNRDDRGDEGYVPYRCFFCQDSISPEDWGTKAWRGKVKNG